MGKSIFKVTEEMKQQLIILYNQGLTDMQIAKAIGGITDGAVFYWRKKLNLKTKFNYSQVSLIEKQAFEELFAEGLTDKEIAKRLNVSPDGVYSFRMRHNYIRENYNIAKPIELTQFQKEVLMGTMLGDSSFILGKNKINPTVSCAHSPAQKEYCEYKTQIFKSLGAVCSYSKRKTPDKRTGKFYESYTMRIPSNPEFLEWRNAFYPKNKKVIPTSLFNYFTAVSLAFMFMDDGAKNGKHAYIICTNCFSETDVTSFRAMLKEKFNLDTTMLKDNMVYIRTNCQRLFENLISPYMIDCMKYKLH